MSDHSFEPPAFPASPTEPVQVATAVEERVARGLILASVAIVAGAVLTVVIWRLGYIASITSFAMAAGAVFLYAQGAGTAPRKGLVPLLAVIVVGVVGSFFAIVASDASDVYSQFAVAGSVSRTSFVMDNIFRGEVLGDYAKDMAMFGVFAVLGIFGTMRQLLRSSH